MDAEIGKRQKEIAPFSSQMLCCCDSRCDVDVINDASRAPARGYAAAAYAAHGVTRG